MRNTIRGERHGHGKAAGRSVQLFFENAESTPPRKRQKTERLNSLVVVVVVVVIVIIVLSGRKLLVLEPV
jgi:hypothetical protein